MKLFSLQAGSAVLFVMSAAVGAYQAQASSDRAKEVAKPFAKFSLKTRSDDRNLYVESNGMPDHPMMVGITAWQQQVPIPQNYTGDNAWQIPLMPVPAKDPLSAKDHFFRGAIALAANGVPIFNPIKNDGRTDTFLAGELDKWGGHSGRGDDYHYHIGPTFLQDKLGKNLPIAYALDGYPLYGATDPDGSKPKNLDAFNGHTTKALGYHYHCTKTYPYINGGFHGEVVDRGGQVDPQPRATSPRPATDPLRGAKITEFKTLAKGKSYSLTYTIDGETRKVSYQIDDKGGMHMEFVDGQGRSSKEDYSGRRGGGDDRGQRPPRDGGGDRNQRPPREGRGPGELGPPPGPRKPWFSDHAKEIDSNGDGEVTKEEVTAQCKAAFASYSKGKSSVDTEELPKMPTFKGAIGGFMKVHNRELDRDSDGKVTEQEVIDSMLRMFDKQDKNGDGKLSGKELEG